MLLSGSQSAGFFCFCLSIRIQPCSPIKFIKTRKIKRRAGKRHPGQQYSSSFTSTKGLWDILKTSCGELGSTRSKCAWEHVQRLQRPLSKWNPRWIWLWFISASLYLVCSCKMRWGSTKNLTLSLSRYGASPSICWEIRFLRFSHKLSPLLPVNCSPK